MSLASYPNGFKKRIVEFKRHHKHGSDLQFSKKGKLLILGEWRKGKPSGVWIFYDNRGNILKEVKGRKLRKTKDPSLKKLIEF
jgi:antitoxin component YwqK of YwqJK toxin-antitoxin module